MTGASTTILLTKYAKMPSKDKRDGSGERNGDEWGILTGAGDVFSEDHRSLEGEGQQHRLTRAKEREDDHHRDCSHVSIESLGISVVFVASSQEDQSVDQTQHDGHADTSHQRGGVTEEVDDLTV